MLWCNLTIAKCSANLYIKELSGLCNSRSIQFECAGVARLVGKDPLYVGDGKWNWNLRGIWRLGISVTNTGKGIRGSRGIIDFCTSG